MKKAAIYARRSTEHQEASLEVQVGEAKRYIQQRGWTVDENHIYQENSVSRAEFKKRPELFRMMDDAKRHEFDVLVIRDETRMGGDVVRSTLIYQELFDAGVKVFFYSLNQEVEFNSSIAKMTAMIRHFASELEREKISERTREHLATKARQGRNVGGKVFGYDNHGVSEGARRLYVDYKINEPEAAVVRRIFEMYSNGFGVRGIVKILNSEGCSSPRAGKRGTGSWSPSVIHAMVRNKRYIGRIEWGRMQKTYKGGTKVRIQQTEPSMIHDVDVPHLRIIPDDLWSSVQARLKVTENKPWDTARGRKPRYLLSGLSLCAKCGGPMQASRRKSGQEIIMAYGCSWHRERGDSVCDNSFKRPVREVDQQVIGWFQEKILREEVVLEVIRRLRCKILESNQVQQDEQPQLQKTIKSIEEKLRRLAEAIASTDSRPEVLVKMISEHEEEKRRLQIRLAALQEAPKMLDNEIEALEDEVRTRIAHLQELLSRHPEQARRILQTLLQGKLKFTPASTAQGKRYLVEGTAAVGGALQVPLTSDAPDLDHGSKRTPTRRDCEPGLVDGDQDPYCSRPQRDSNPRYSLERAVSWAD